MNKLEALKRYQNYLVNPDDNLWSEKPEGATANTELDALCAVARDLLVEAKDIAIKRNVTTLGGFEGVYRQQRQVFYAFIAHAGLQCGPEFFKLVAEDVWPVLKPILNHPNYKH